MARKQLDLFGGTAEAATGTIGPAPVPPSMLGIAERLSERIRLGTSSWSFAGWAGLVYDRAAPQSALSRHGLAPYAAHPLLRAVSIDRSFYGPLSPEHYAAWAAAVPDAFRFAVKIDRACTQPDLRTDGTTLLPNPLFLDPDHALRSTLEPATSGLGPKIGAFILQVPPVPARAVGGPRAFALRLDAFLDRVAGDIPIGVELRSPDLFTPRYAEVLAAHDAVHCHTVHPRMRPLAEQLAAIPAGRGRILMIRWMLHAGFAYDEAKAHYHPFDRIVDADVASRDIIARACREADAEERDAYVLINNKAEGSAPLSVMRLAEHIVEGRSPG